jgi:hypothetical protein
LAYAQSISAQASIASRIRKSHACCLPQKLKPSVAELEMFQRAGAVKIVADMREELKERKERASGP